MMMSQYCCVVHDLNLDTTTTTELLSGGKEEDTPKALLK